ncbi:MAG TPA: translation initiation factor IF-2 [Balneolales bacterium]|nr:translation initiation factor IF-2 [Balneolales bacterium]
MARGGKQYKLFRVAKEFNVSYQSIAETLSEQGYKIDSRPNSTITPEMYKALEDTYGTDKVRSQEHVVAREEYQERRNALRQNRFESVSIENFIEPIDEEGETSDEEELPIEPADGKEEKKKNKTEETSVHESSEKTKVEETESEAQEEELEPDVEEETEPEIVKPQPEEKKKEKEAPKKPAVEKKPEKEEEKPEPEEEQPKEKEIPVSHEEDEEEDIEEEYDEEEEESEENSVIRANTEKLRGTKVLGTIKIQKEEPTKPKKGKGKGKQKEGEEEAPSKKKKKRRLKKNRTTQSETTEEESKKKKKKSKKRPQRIDEEHVEQKMKETMQLLKSTGGVGKKRQKRRRMRREEIAERRQEAAELAEGDNKLEVTEFITVSDLADLLNVSPTNVITSCMNLGIMVSINQRLEASTIELIAEEYGYEAEFVDAEEMLEDIEEEEDEPEDLKERPPVVTVMGHVDHGKTSLLDYVRKTHITAGEAGGITQHIGAYSVDVGDGRKITFLDTPGHEAFTAMRARGAQVTDIVILVVAADDAVMPQTIEAINHALAAGVSIVVAINKVDKPGANVDKIRQQLSEHNVMVESWGGKYQEAEVSAKTGQGVSELLEKVLIEAELLELKANPDRNAHGIILESRIDKGKGVVANLLVQKGTLRVGDSFVAGPYFGRVRAMENEFGQRMSSVGPSEPTQITGFDGLPQAGDKLICMPDEKRAREIAQQRQQIKREQDLRHTKHITLDDLSRRMALGEVAELNIIIKGDVDGSIEALAGSLQKLSTDEVKVNIIHTGVGAITESDVLLASASDAIIIGFQVRPSSSARKLAEQEEIDVRLFSVIYDAVDAVRDAMEGLLSPEIGEEIVATLEVRETFKVPSVGTVAGCYVTDGKLTRNDKVRIVRDGIVIYNGELDSLKRFKDDVREVTSGYECGLSIHNFNDIKVDDVIEGYRVTEKKRTLA